MDQTEEKRTQWHPGFCSAMRLEFRDNREDLEYMNEYNLNSKPLQMDLFVIKKDIDIELQNEIGKIFRRYNIIEYKSPDAALSIDTYYKGLAYACLYKAGGAHVNEKPADEITLTFVRTRKPVALLRQLRESGRMAARVSDGIYHVNESLFAVQIVVASELCKEEHLWLCSLTGKLSHEGAKRLIYETNGLERKDEKDFADSVLEVAMSANKAIFQRVKEGAEVCEALRKLMEPEMKQAITKAVDEAVSEKDAVIANQSVIITDQSAVIADQSERIKQLEEELANKCC